MHSLQNFNYNGTVIQRRHDGFINITQMCQANGKKVSHWLTLKGTQAYIASVASETGIPASKLLDVVKGGQSAFQGTWGHELVAMHLAQWISPSFHVWCNAHIFNLMETGQTSLDVDPLAEMKLRVELAKYEAQKETAIHKATELRNLIVKTCPEPVQQKILGYQTVEVTKYRDRVLLEEEIIRHGDTLNKTELCHRYGFLTRNGKPNYARLNKALANCRLPSEAWKLTATIRENSELREEFLEDLDQQIIPGDRQLFLGE